MSNQIETILHTIPVVLASLEVINVVHLDRFHNFTSVILNNFIVQVS